MTVQIVSISGGPRERGRQYGEAARAKIDTAIAWYSESFQTTAGMSWAEIAPRSRAWVPLIESYSPGILEEVRGIAEGAGRTFEDILALNGRGELHTGNPFEESHPEQARPEEDCSSYAVLGEAAGDGHTYAGQNWDWQCATADTVMMLHVEQPGRPSILMQVEAGQVGRHGMNSAGITLNANGLGPRFGPALGVPGTFVRRKILDAWNMNDALEAAFEAPQAFSTNLMLTHRDGFAIDLETTPGRHGWMYPEAGILVHGNHFEAFVPEQINGTYKPFSVDSLYRVQRIRTALQGVRRAGTSAEVREVIAGAMSDHFGRPQSVCNHDYETGSGGGGYATVASSIVDLTTGEYRLARGNPCEAPYELLSVNVLDGPATPAEAGRPVTPVPQGVAS